ncbi:hypothetical protein RvY_07209-2 [Ramazzottius varieornatus]|uniref:Metallo-beta-lactamase domain-containing protein n=1 Tax=Ramazzottius varieornatus TaxID=947166 RepID=A0A1D1V3Y6_RAMVA|nr:hypothetical protein RvY_07209-2 [Ramazzottius varieornatus]
MSRPQQGQPERGLFRPRGMPNQIQSRMQGNASQFPGGQNVNMMAMNAARSRFPPGVRGPPGFPPQPNFGGNYGPGGPRGDFAGGFSRPPMRGFGPGSVNMSMRGPPMGPPPGAGPRPDSGMFSGPGGNNMTYPMQGGTSPAGPRVAPVRPYQRGGGQVQVTPPTARTKGGKREGKGRNVDEEDILSVRPLGAGQEVGRSCILLDFKGKKILLDMGIHPAFNGHASLPYLDHINVDEIELLLITHFHLDHCGALPFFLMKTKFKGRTFMTHATKAIYRWMLSDFLRVSQGQEQLFTEADIEKSMDKIETLDFHEEKEVGGVRFWCYTAGHVLGAAMFMIEIAGVRILYTGDFSKEEDRHLCAAEIPSVRADVVIMEATYGIHVHEDRETREHRFLQQVRSVLMRGGKCLIPAFALGRAQEIQLILDEYWAMHPEMQEYPIYYASVLAKKCMAVYQTYTGAMNDRIKKKIAVHNPFNFKFIQPIRVNVPARLRMNFDSSR